MIGFCFYEPSVSTYYRFISNFFYINVEWEDCVSQKYRVFRMTFRIQLPDLFSDRWPPMWPTSISMKIQKVNLKTLEDFPESPVEFRLYPLGYFGKTYIQKVPIELTSLNPEYDTPFPNRPTRFSAWKCGWATTIILPQKGQPWWATVNKSRCLGKGRWANPRNVLTSKQLSHT